MPAPRSKPRQRAEPQQPSNDTLETVVRTLPTPAAAQTRDPTPAARERIGDILRRAREKRGDDLQQIADYLCIRRSFLVALEGSRYEEFPADAYVIGFLRSYAEFLGLDGKDAIDYYRHEMAGRRKKPVLSMPSPLTEGRAPSAIILVGAVIAALLIYAVWYGFSTSDRAAISTPPALPTAVPDTPTPHADIQLSPTQSLTEAPMSNIAPATAAMQPALVQAPSTTAAPVVPTKPATAQPAVQASTIATQTAPAVQAQAAPAPAAPIPHLTIKAEDASWVLITDARGHSVFDRVMKAGEVYKVPDTPGLSLTTGNGAGILLTLDGVNLPKLASGTAHVIRNVPLSHENLKSLAQQAND